MLNYNKSSRSIYFNSLFQYKVSFKRIGLTLHKKIERVTSVTKMRRTLHRRFVPFYRETKQAQYDAIANRQGTEIS